MFLGLLFHKFSEPNSRFTLKIDPDVSVYGVCHGFICPN